MRLSQPTWTRGLPTTLVVAVATLGPVGRKLPAPGTWGAAAGLLWVTAVFWLPRLGVGATLVLCALSGYLAVAFCGEAEIRLRKQDPGEVILDEFVAMPLCFLGWRTLVAVWPPWAVLLAGFAVFRFYDIAKPLGIHRLQRLPGGWGVVIDDTAAALATCATLHLGGAMWLGMHRAAA